MPAAMAAWGNRTRCRHSAGFPVPLDLGPGTDSIGFPARATSFVSDAKCIWRQRHQQIVPDSLARAMLETGESFRED